MEGLKGTRWDAPITLTQGDAVDGSSTSFSKHFRAERITIANNTLVNNTHNIEIGFDNNGNYNKGLKDIIIANNIVTGSENSLIAYMDGNNNDGEITWSNNILYPTGNASLTSDNSTFPTNQINVLDPFLIFDGTTWRSTSGSPMSEFTISNLEITQDIDGHIRPNLSTVGADHFSLDDVLSPPVTIDDVGPSSFIPTAIEDSQSNLSPIKIFPNPTAEFLKIEGLTKEMESIQIFTFSGKLVWERSLTYNTKSNLDFNIGSLSNGFYFIKIKGLSGQFSQKIFIAK